MSRSIPIFNEADTLLFSVDYDDCPRGGVVWAYSWLNVDPATIHEMHLFDAGYNPLFLGQALLRLQDGRWCCCSWEEIHGRRVFAGRLVTACRASALLEGCDELPPGVRALLDADCEREAQTPPAPPQGAYVTLNQMAAIVNRSKRTLERLKTKGIIPLPDVEGGSGDADEWLWERVRPILSERFRRPLPEHFPALRPH